MTAPDKHILDDQVQVLLERSLIAWRLIGRARRIAEGTEILALGRTVTVTRAPAGIPFRWMVTVDSRSRPAVSVVAVLRQVRHALDPGYASSRVRIAAMPVLPPG
jgi:hypothetical protein